MKTFSSINETISEIKRVIKKNHMTDLRYCRGYFTRLRGNFTTEPRARRVQMAFMPGIGYNVIVCYNEDVNYTCVGLIKMVITITRDGEQFNVNVERK